jgi:RNA polymerase sigma factor (sigma-70 family)
VHAAARGARGGAGVGLVVDAVTTGRLDPAALIAAHRAAFLRRARRYSLCADDADDALQRAVEILLTRSHGVDPDRILPWMLTVVGREALAVRRRRLRELGGRPAGEGLDPVAITPSDGPGPLDRLEHRERVQRAARLLRRLKPQERRALALQAEGYSYAEIQEITGWTHTKVNRCLAEGRARLRQLLAGRPLSAG